MSWTCTGVRADGTEVEPHPPHNNTGLLCDVCCLRKDDVVGSSGSGGGGGQSGSGSSLPVKPIAIAAAAVVALAGGAFAVSKMLGGNNGGGGTAPAATTTTPPANVGTGTSPATPPSGTPLGSGNIPIANCAATDPDDFVSECADKSIVELFSQGERTLIKSSKNVAEKEAASTKFALRDWGAATSLYEAAVAADSNDPEAQIYLNNAKAMESGDPIVVSVVAPLPLDDDTGKEILRGVATAQKQFNDRGVERLMAVVVVDAGDATPENALEGEIAGVLMGAGQVLGIIGHGATEYSASVLMGYAAQNLPVLAPMTIELTEDIGTNNSILTTVPIAQGVDDLYKQYVIKALATLIEHAKATQQEAKVTLVFDSRNPYSNYLKEQFEANEETLSPGAKLDAIDIGVETSLDGSAIVNKARTNDSNSILLALPGETGVSVAISVAQNNDALGPDRLLLMGDAALYSPQLLINGESAVNDMVLAVPWRWEETDDGFSKDTAQLWKGRVSWRTTAAFDATDLMSRVLRNAPDRAQASQILSNGVEVGATQADYNVIDSVPLVCVQPKGSGGPSGSNYSFVSVENGCL